jgi:hypothetical protein
MPYRFMPYPQKGENRNTGRTLFKKGFTPWNKGLKGAQKSWNKGLTIADPRVRSFVEAGHAANRGRVYTEEFKQRLSLLHKKGKESHLWKGGCIPWAKQQAKRRDDFTCQLCWLRDPLIAVVDHIRPKAIAPHLEAEISNLMTLCPNCHAHKTISDRKNIRAFKKAITAD